MNNVNPLHYRVPCHIRMDRPPSARPNTSEKGPPNHQHSRIHMGPTKHGITFFRHGFWPSLQKHVFMFYVLCFKIITHTSFHIFNLLPPRAVLLFSTSCHPNGNSSEGVSRRPSGFVWTYCTWEPRRGSFLRPSGTTSELAELVFSTNSVATKAPGSVAENPSAGIINDGGSVVFGGRCKSVDAADCRWCVQIGLHMEERTAEEA